MNPKVPSLSSSLGVKTIVGSVESRMPTFAALPKEPTADLPAPILYRLENPLLLSCNQRILAMITISALKRQLDVRHQLTRYRVQLPI